MPSVKIPKKSTDTDMTPFVDIAFLILSFFIMATKFKPQDPVEITTPNSVSAELLPTDNAVMILIDKENKVFFSVLSEKDPKIFDQIIQGVNTKRNLGLTPAEIANFRKTVAVGVPFTGVKQLLGMPGEDQKNLKQPGIPVLDSATNELVWWINEAKNAFAGSKLKYLIKGDGASKFPTFDAVVSALKRNDELKYSLVTVPEDIPATSELGRIKRETEGSK
ncbi:MAG: biopolymer transporter ExbD [Chitinophagaceae bacterium]